MPYRGLRLSADLVLGAVGRRELIARTGDRIGPFLCAVARRYRTTAIRSTRVVAVVGSFGKTTTSRAVVAALAAPQRHSGLNSEAWVALGLLRIKPGQRHAVIEVGISRPGQMVQRAQTVRPDIAVVTSVGSEHNRSLTSLETTRHEKAEMVRVLPASGLAVLNGDDPNVSWMAGETRAPVMTFGGGAGTDVRATAIAIDWPHGTRFTIHTPQGARDVRIRLVGRAMVNAVLAAAAVALHEGQRLDEVLARLETLAPTPGRLEPVRLPSGAMLLCDEFKAPEETIDAALDVLADIRATRRIVVMGDVDEPARPQRRIYRRLGQRIGRCAERAVFVTRDEHFSSSRAGAREGGLPAGAITKVRSVSAALEQLRDLGAGDVVLIKGRHTQRLQRIVLALTGRDVRCDLEYCNARLMECTQCPMLGRSWSGVWIDDPAARTDRRTGGFLRRFVTPRAWRGPADRV
jgi:UDP-N-acetylmuramoyl-tripeptide--D-alanyl-D-alanine ligase